jgi:hypothetical protein
LDRLLRHLTPIVLIALGLVVWFEPRVLGDRGVMRIAVGVLCFYMALLVIERQRMEVTFRDVLAAFQRFKAERLAETARGAEPSPQQKREAIAILIAALRADSASARQHALQNLQRLTGQDFGPDAAAWERWFAGQGQGDG